MMVKVKRQRWSWAVCGIAATSLLLSTQSFGGEIAGQVLLTANRKPLRVDEAREAVVYFKSAVSVPLVPPKTPLIMRTERKTFVPSVLPILQNSKVSFPNSDPILHNAFSTAKGNLFDTGLYGKGEGESHTFTSVGVVRVYCNVHHSMVAHILVLDTSFFASPDNQGRFVLRDLPEGEGELFVWHERATLWRQRLNLSADQNLEIPLNLSKRRVPPHLNKFGKPYRRAGAGDY